MTYLHLNKDESTELIKSTVRLAHLARTKFVEETSSQCLPWIAGSIGPFGAHLHDASEYTGNYAKTITVDEIKKWHRERIDAILAVGVDLLAIETIPCAVEAKALLDVMGEEYPEVKFWISMQCKVSL